MLFIENPSLDPYFNVATEEYLLKNMDSDIVMVWCSHPSVIVGKHQNTLAEIDVSYVVNNNIPVIRRLSGGGTVFHDLGNINFTFIQRGHKNKLVDFQAYTAPIIAFLATIGVEAVFEGNNNIRVNGLKISGNAEHIFKNKVLHHGTLLFDADLEILNKAIKGKETRFTSKAVKSVRSTVTNISSLPGVSLTRIEFREKLADYLQNHFPNTSIYKLTDHDKKEIEKLKQEKYTQWEWNFGYSPQYLYKNKGEVLNRNIHVELLAKKGVIENVRLSIDYISQDHNPIVKTLVGTPHNPASVERILSHQNFMGFNQITNKWLLTGLFF